MMRYLEAVQLQCNYDIAVLFVGKGMQTIERNRSKKIMSVRCGAEIGRYSGKKVSSFRTLPSSALQ